jgi:hypothetical protein
LDLREALSVTGSFFGGLHDFFHSTAWSIIELLAALFVLLFWAATVYWVRKDARRRIQSRSLIQLVTVIGAVPPFLGPLVYMLFRPPEYLEDVRERKLEIQAIERRLELRECPACHVEVDSDFLVCPVCTMRLRHSCVTCLRPLDSAWLVCPYCETPTGIGETPGLWPSAVATPPRSPRTPRTSSRKAT